MKKIFTSSKLVFCMKIYILLLLLYFGNHFLFVLAKNFSFSLTLSCLIGACMLAAILILLSLLPKRACFALGYMIVLVSCLAFLIDYFCWSVFETPLSTAMLMTAIETNLAETQSFVELYLTWNFVLMVFLIAALAFLFFKLILPIKVKSWGGGVFIVFALVGLGFWLYEFLLMFGGGYSCQYRNSLSFISPLRQACNLSLAVGEGQRAKHFLEESMRHFKENSKDLKLVAANDIQNIVLILGESLQRGHMQVYGYSKPTNPQIMSLAKSKNLLRFDNVISSHAQTTLSLRKVLTFLNYENEDKIDEVYLKGNLISLFNAANYKTYWISNQLNELHAGIIGIIASSSLKYYFPSQYKQYFDDVFYDEVLFPYLEQSLLANKQSRKMFVVHLMGNHASYGNRYPRSYRYFDDSIFGGYQRTIARYDNATLYNDFIVSEILNRFSKTDSLVIYISDHGEELYEQGSFVGHSDDRISRFMVEVPMLVYASDLFIQKHPKIYQKLRSSLNKPYMTDDLIHTLLDLAGIDARDFDPKRSLINEKFDASRARIVGGRAGRDYDGELK